MSRAIMKIIFAKANIDSDVIAVIASRNFRDSLGFQLILDGFSIQRITDDRNRRENNLVRKAK